MTRSIENVCAECYIQCGVRRASYKISLEMIHMLEMQIIVERYQV
ncbi:hypothetical protein PDK32_08880 [Bacillus cereus]|nr:hypothetical protein [Bacillus cereus]